MKDTPLSLRKETKLSKAPYELIDDIAKLYSLQVARATERSGIAYGYRKLLACLSHGEEMPQLDLIELTNLTPATVSTSMAKLEAAGVVSRRFDPRDKRKYYVKLTQLGKKRWEAIQKRSEELNGVMMKGISLQEAEVLGNILERMLENLVDADR